MSGVAILHQQVMPTAGMSTEDIITISDESTDWKDVSESTAAAARLKKVTKAAAKSSSESCH